jgi:hypothetical protein
MLSISTENLPDALQAFKTQGCLEQEVVETRRHGAVIAGPSVDQVALELPK